jgi:hypothetical protein
MTNDGTTPDGEQSGKGANLGHISESIFTPEETVSLVKGFVLAWMRGDVEVQFPFAEEIIKDAEREGKNMTVKEASEEELSLHKEVEHYALVCLGTIPSTKEQRQEAVNNLAQFIIRLRDTQRAKGKFSEFDIEQRILGLETRIDALDNVVSEFIRWLRGP